MDCDQRGLVSEHLLFGREDLLRSCQFPNWVESRDSDSWAQVLLCGLPREGRWSHVCGNSTLNGCSCHWTVRAQLLSLVRICQTESGAHVWCAFVRLSRSSHYWVRRHAELTWLLCLVSCAHLGEAGRDFGLLLCSESRSSSFYHQCLFLVAALPLHSPAGQPEVLSVDKMFLFFYLQFPVVWFCMPFLIQTN